MCLHCNRTSFKGALGSIKQKHNNKFCSLGLIPINNAGFYFVDFSMCISLELLWLEDLFCKFVVLNVGLSVNFDVFKWCLYNVVALLILEYDTLPFTKLYCFVTIWKQTINNFDSDRKGFNIKSITLVCLDV